jgi:hypothetical protein
VTVKLGAKQVAVAAVLGIAFLIGTAYERPDRFRYRIVEDVPSRAESQVNSLAKDGWEPVALGAGGARPIEGEINSPTRHGGLVYVLLRRPR